MNKPEAKWIPSPHCWPDRKVDELGPYKPMAIVCHVMDGTLEGTDSWFQDPSSQVSAHYGIGRDGTIHQYVREEDAAWANGYVEKPDWPVLRETTPPGVNPNLWTLSIEHEGWGEPGKGDGTQGALTDAQFAASATLIAYLVERWGIIVDADHIVGHHRIDSVNRANCPGVLFPWERLFAALTPAPARKAGKLGALPYTPKPEHLQLARYLKTTALPPLPAQFGHETCVGVDSWGMLGNDSLGDCVEAGICHQVMAATAEGAGTPVAMSDADATSAYHNITGWDPGPDAGTYPEAAMDYWLDKGFQDAAGNYHKIAAWLAVDVTNLQELFYAVYLFGSVGLCLNFPKSAFDQFNAGQPWSVVSGSPIDGGHYVPLLARRDMPVCVTWGQLQKMTQDFLTTYASAAFVPLSEEILNAKGISPEDFDWAQLQADLAALPNVSPTPPPAPTPPTPPPTPPAPVPPDEVVVTAGWLDYMMAGKTETADTPPVLLDPPGHLFVSVRTVAAIIEGVLPGITVTVAWDEPAKTATLTW